MAKLSDAQPYRYHYRTPEPPRRRGPGLKILISFAMVLFIAGSVCSGLVFVTRITGGVTPFPLLPGGGLIGGGPVGGEGGVAPDWSRKERVNVLLLGVDERSDQRGDPIRTDTMIVVSIDPASNTAVMLSLPRDLWVPIPFEDRQLEDRINTAHFWGEVYNYPGGGPALAKRTVQYNLGIPIHYYARINFDGFEAIVDTLGGIDVDVPTAIRDDRYPTEDYGTMTISFEPGRQHLNGKRALQYARTRHQDSDFGRMKRQQQVMMAIRDRALQLDVIPKLPQLANQFQNTVSTDMSLSDILALGQIGKGIEKDNIVVASLDEAETTPIVTTNGADVLMPNRAAIQKLISSLFGDGRIQTEQARVEVLNGTMIDGLATRTAETLRERGIEDVVPGNVADGQLPTMTKVIDAGGKPFTAEFIADTLGLSRDRIESKPDPDSVADIVVILGEDFTPID